MALTRQVLEDGLVRPQFGPMYKVSGIGGMLEVNRTVAVSPPSIHRSLSGYTLSADAVTSSGEGRGADWSQDIRPPHATGGMMALPPHANPEVDMVCDVQPSVVLISWNALNQTVRTVQWHMMVKRSIAV